MFVTVSDLEPFATIEASKAQAMIDDAEAMAVLAAPCIADDGFAHSDAVRAILRGAVLRWNEAGTGALQQQTQANGPFTFGQTYDTRQPRRAMFQADEIASLRNLCGDAQATSYTLSLAGPDLETA